MYREKSWYFTEEEVPNPQKVLQDEDRKIKEGTKTVFGMISVLERLLIMEGTYEE